MPYIVLKEIPMTAFDLFFFLNTITIHKVVHLCISMYFAHDEAAEIC